MDIGAGTSDVAITKNGSVIAYGMVPQAGDEITEAISQRFLLDFNVAEKLKRDASAGKSAKFSDILGMEYELSAEENILVFIIDMSLAFLFPQRSITLLTLISLLDTLPFLKVF